MFVFISYRRGTTNALAQRLSALLQERLGAGTVFLDTETLEPGEHFNQTILRAIANCRFFIVLIGKDWAPERLHQLEDHVRFEIQQALLQPSVEVIPVLAEAAALPQRDQLPESVRPVLERQAVTVHANNVASDTKRLLSRISKAWPDARAAHGRARWPRKRWFLVAACILTATAWLFNGSGASHLIGACGKDVNVVIDGSVDQSRTVLENEER
jgi:hypothetical protein